MPSQTITHIGRKIKKLRKDFGLTQEELAEKTKLDYKYLQKIEGKTPTNLKLETIEKLARALKTTPAKLLEP